MDQTQQNIICIMEEFQKQPKKKKSSISPSCNGKRIMRIWMWICLLVTFQSRLPVLSGNVQILYKKCFATDTDYRKNSLAGWTLQWIVIPETNKLKKNIKSVVRKRKHQQEYTGAQ